MTRALASLALAALALGGCGPRYQAIEFELLSQPPVPVRVNGDEIELPVGIAVAIHATLESSTRIEYVPGDSLELDSRDRSILMVDPTPGSRNFVLFGVAPGETCLAVEVEYEEEECIPVRVTAAE